MQKIINLLLLFCTINCYALDLDSLPLLDKITFQIVAKKWVQTNNADLIVNVNATLSNENLTKVRTDIMKELNRIVSGDWHIIVFDRSQDNSGLEKLTVQATARVAQSTLNDAYKNAKNVSKPGKTYEINSIEFKPSLSEIQAVKSELRKELSLQVQKELENINKIYTNQSYSVSNLVFADDEIPQSLQTKAFQIRDMAKTFGASGAADISLSNELKMSAFVEIASNRKVLQP